LMCNSLHFRPTAARYSLPLCITRWHFLNFRHVMVDHKCLVRFDKFSQRHRAI